MLSRRRRSSSPKGNLDPAVQKEAQEGFDQIEFGINGLLGESWATVTKPRFTDSIESWLFN